MRLPGFAAASALVALAAAFSLNSAAAPFVPASDAEVLERLPRGMPRPKATMDLKSAAGEARRLIDAARGEGDPRYLGQAQAVLRQWWGQARPPAEVLLLRATIRQSLHEFDAAMRDLDELLRAEPRNPQALLTRAAILLARGQPARAQADCLELAGRAPQLVMVACATQAASLAGQGPAAYAALSAALDGSPQAGEAVRAWALGLLAEMAARLERHRDAGRHFAAALALAPRDAYTLGAYCDWLMDQGRPREVVALIEAGERNDSLLLRRALALRQLNDGAAQAEAVVLRERFAAQRLRGNTIHAREEGRFRLAFDADPRAALALARENWEQQKEPADLRLMLEASAAAGDKAAARPALEWMRANRFDDAALRPLAAKLS